MLSYHLLDNIKLFSGHAYYRVMVTPENDRIYYNKEEIHLENGMRAELTLFPGKSKDIPMDDITTL